MKTQLNQCPKCSSDLEITKYTCQNCETVIEGRFSGCAFCGLNDDDRLFALVFIQTEGNMRDVERLMGISYPTIKSRIAKLNQELRGESLMAVLTPPPRQMANVLRMEKKAEILDKLANGEIAPDEAARLLRGESIKNNKF